ncbi:flagellar protein FliT [Paludibacterium yongneupense]|uniref:flagellar protein FliT n=1 Tax=Paludibacterium yongneupense TaxID=400061 RepID=UPI000423D115|nr:flagellar protein FliT [Paludibacterium yongneupense]
MDEKVFDDFLGLTDRMLDLAQRQEWDDFVAMLQQRSEYFEQIQQGVSGAWLESHAESRAAFARALVKNREIEAILDRTCLELKARMSSLTQQKRLRQSYRS